MSSSLLSFRLLACVFHCLFCYIHVWYIHIFLNMTCSVCIILLVCIVSGLTIWYWTTVGVRFPWEDCFFPSQHASVACAPLCSTEAFGLYLILFTLFSLPCLVLLSLSDSCLAVILVKLDRCGFWHCWVTQSHIKFPDLLTLRVFCPVLQCSPRLRGRSCFVLVSIGTGRHNSAFWLLWLSKRSFLRSVYGYQARLWRQVETDFF